MRETLHSHDSEVLIRPAVRSDGPGILRCLQAAFAPYKSSYSGEAFRDTTLTANLLNGRLATMSVFVAIAADEIVGTLSCEKVSAEEGHLRGMAVMPPWQGSGVANRLLAAVEEHLRSSGCNYVTLDTTTPLKRAAQFYERRRYRPTGNIAEYFGMALFEYRKDLNAAAENVYAASDRVLSVEPRKPDR